jgi:hypothetical protein
MDSFYCLWRKKPHVLDSQKMAFLFITIIIFKEFIFWSCEFTRSKDELPFFGILL